MAKNKQKRKRPIGLMTLIILVALVYFGLRMLYPIAYTEQIEKEAHRYAIDPYLVTAMIHTESHFDEKARSSKNAQGLMQVTESTWNWALSKMDSAPSGTDPSVAKDNLEVGVWYLNYLNNTFSSHDEVIVLAAYNAGEGNVRKWLKDPEFSEDGATLTNIPFPETAAYVQRIERAKLIYQVLYPNVFNKRSE